KYGEKLRCREAIIHSNFIGGNRSNKRKKNRSAICLFFLKKLSAKSDQNNDLNYFSNRLNDYIEKLNLNKNSIIFKGDGARWMKSISQKIGVKYVLDYFHLVKKINETFGFNHFASKENKKVFTNWYSAKYRLRWVELFRKIFSKNDKLGYEAYVNFRDNFIFEARQKQINNKCLLAAKRLFYFIENHKDQIWNDENKICLIASYTEHFVFNYFKKHIKKMSSTFGLNSIKTKIIYKNLKKGVGTIFL
ncbi:Mbov_0401 family ICE element transposase-like protein, partial [Mycoplasma sp. HS2188]|uniref:Mbov_0401 family ICE element transposase-like protein n=1 Tax=Mycoplasma sp. HS2188 TaxID=2976765 RepID=UPI0037C78A1A|nr:integrative conjugal element protein [Mycoplasma sp. HS2188]